jgi:hypothetical protein
LTDLVEFNQFQTAGLEIFVAKKKIKEKLEPKYCQNIAKKSRLRLGFMKE